MPFISTIRNQHLPLAVPAQTGCHPHDIRRNSDQAIAV